MARVRTSAVSLSLPVGPSLDGTSGIVGSRSRVLLAAGALAASALLARALRRSPSDALRRRLLRRLDRIAPRVRYTDEIGAALSNGTCPVCLGDFAAAPERLLRVQTCGHALCAECLEGWVVHQAKSHLNPSRFGMTRGGDIVSWHCPPYVSPFLYLVNEVVVQLYLSTRL